jgi:GYF domain 2
VTQGAIWYVECRGQQLGPYDVETVIGLIHGGQVDGSASVSAPYLNGWTPISREPTFAPHLPAASQPPPQPHPQHQPQHQPQPQPQPQVPPAFQPQVQPRGPMVSDGKGLRIAGWILLGTAAFFLLVIPLMALDEDAKSGNWSGGVMVWTSTPSWRDATRADASAT